ncbi:MAG: hypothetical protein Q8O34_11975 [Rhodocyclaceae bacterium]|nr:hypothetical protein [Rhodocyclaceae bacterium]
MKTFFAWIWKSWPVPVFAVFALAMLCAVSTAAWGQVVFQSASSAFGINNAISHVGAGAAVTRDAGCPRSVSPASPAGNVGDLLIALAVAREESATVVASAGWTALYSGNYAGQEFRVYMFHRIADGSGADTLTVTESGTCGSLAARVARFRGVDTATPFLNVPVPAGNVVSQNANNVDTGTETTVAADAMLLVASFVNDNNGITEGAGWTASFESALNLNQDLALNLHYQLQTTAGAKSISNWSIGVTDENFGIIFSLNPAASAGRQITLPMPSGTVVGNVLVASLAVRKFDATVTPPAGWTLREDTPQSSGAVSCTVGTTAGIRLLTYYKVAGASEPSATWTYSSTCFDDGFAGGGILRFSGVDTASPVVNSAEATTASALLHQAPAVTPGITDTLLVTVHSYGSSRSWNEGYAGVAGMTERVDQRSYNADNARGTALGMYTQSISGAGSTGTRTAQGAGDADNGATHSLILRPAPTSPATCNTGTVSGIINTYYPGAASVSAGATAITVGAGSGAATALAQNDLVLVMQMQDAAIDTTNTSAYGVASLVNAGKYEYATVSSVAGSTVTLTGGLTNAYTTAAYGASGQKTFQVIRVPVYSTATLGAATAKAWDGSSGGVLAFDIIGTLTLAGATADVSGKGFRGGGGCRWIGDNVTGGLSASDYRRNASTTCPSGAQAAGRTNGLKGEGIAGTPRYAYDGSARVNTGVEGYPNGSTGRGAPANAGGGGTDDDPVNNDENTGGGGGANAGAGGMGGYGWSAPASPGRGIGGTAVSSSANRLVLGGGAGAATTNNGTTDGNGLNSSGVAGGGIIMVRAGSLSGTGTFSASGANNTLSVGNDGSGGGGAAGSVLAYAAGGLSGLTVNANGGYGGSNTGGGVEHGPGGGGGGGYVMTSAALAACNVNGGLNGTTFSSSAFGATPGGAGSCATTLTTGQMPGAAFGAGPCVPALHHYGISYPLGVPGVTCEALAVRITGHNSAHTAVAPAAGTQITLLTTPAAGGWALRSGGGTFTAPNQYAFNGSENYVDLWLTQTTPTTTPHIDIDVTDGTRTDVDGDAGEDAKAQFVGTAFKYYACTGLVPGTCSEVSINNQIAGKPSNAAPNAQNLYLRAVRTDDSTGACLGGLVGAQDVGFGYECDSPSTCYAGNLMSINGGTATTIARNDDGTISASTGSYTNVPMTFDANGFAPFNLNYSDAGQVTLHARKTVTAGVGTPPSTAATLYGASNAFVVRPFAFELTVPGNPKATAFNGTIFKAAGDNFDATVRGVVWQAADDADNDGLPDSGADLSGNATTPNYAWATDLSADGTAGSYTPLPAQGGVLGLLSPSPATLAQASFSNGQASAGGQAVPFSLTWSEVGSFTLKADATNYLGVAGLNVSGRVIVGRFTPHHFGIAGSVINRSDLATPGGTFTYMGEPMGLTLTVTAYNASDGVTRNYVGNFAKLDTATLGTGANWFNTGCAGQCMGLGAVNDAATDTGLSGRLAIDTGIANPAGSWTAGVGTFTAHVSLARNATPDGPYDTLKVGGMPRDSEGVTLPGPASADTHKVDLDAATGDTLASNPDGTNERRWLFDTKARFGRLWLGNAYGSDKLNLTVPFEAQHWNGNAFVTNTLDSLTGLVSGNIALGNPQGGLVGYTGPIISVSNPVAAGKGSIVLTKPAASATGSVDLVVNLGATGSPSDCLGMGGGTSAAMAYLSGKWCGASHDRNPTARATFGVFGSSLKKGPIYLRESY